MSQHVQGLIDELLDRMAWPTTNNSAHRAQCLRWLQNVENAIAQRGSFLYLSQRTTLTLPNAESSVAAPADLDPLKATSIIDDLGELPFMPLGVFDTESKDTAYMIRPLQPGSWTMAKSGTALTIFFNRANGTGSSIVFTIVYQQVPSALTDTNTSYSALPAGYERTILLDAAEIEGKRILRIPMPDWKIQLHQSALDAFYGANRTTKPAAETDTEIIAEKSWERIAPGR